MVSKTTESNKNYINVEEWEMRYVPKKILIEQKYKEFADNPKALAGFLAKYIVSNT